jgi:AraC-like DNA-binding protein
MELRPITWRRHEDALNRWAVATAPAARGFDGAIERYGHYEEQVGGFVARREMPGTQALLLINLGDDVQLTGGDGVRIAVGAGEGFVAGVHCRPAVSAAPTGRQRGVHVYLPVATLRRLFRIDMDEIQDRVVRLDALAPADFCAVGARLVDTTPERCFAVMDDWLGRVLAEAPPADGAVDWVVGRLNADPGARIEALAAHVGWSRKHLATRFRASTGVTPRTYARLRRFERLLGCLAHGTRPDWADLAAAHGFADQPHLARDVRDLSGLTPTMLVDRMLPGGGGFLEE